MKNLSMMLYIESTFMKYFKGIIPKLQRIPCSSS